MNNLLGFNLAVNKNQKDYRILNRLMLKTSMNVLYVDFIPFFVFRFGQRSYENTKILCNVCLFFIIHLACLALQMENIVKKIMQPNDQSIASTKTKYIKLNTKTPIFFLLTFDFCIHFKWEIFFLFLFSCRPCQSV